MANSGGAAQMGGPFAGARDGHVRVSRERDLDGRCGRMSSATCIPYSVHGTGAPRSLRPFMC